MLGRSRLTLLPTSNSIFYDSETIGNTPIEEETKNKNEDKEKGKTDSTTKVESVQNNQSTVTFIIPKTSVD